MKTNFLKIGVLGLMMLAGTAMQAQQVTGDVAQNIAAGVNTPGSVEPTVRVIDNKGTIKYLQSKNGITMLTNSTTDVTTTTWQLGGVLTDDTTIDASGAMFAITGIDGLDATANPVSDIPATAFDGTGYTIMVRDEATGETKKMLATDLLQSGQEVFTAAADQVAYPLTLGDLPLPAFQTVWVYRNGAKLIAGADYTVAASTVTLVPANATGPNGDWAVYANDIIEVHFVK